MCLGRGISDQDAQDDGQTDAFGRSHALPRDTVTLALGQSRAKSS